MAPKRRLDERRKMQNREAQRRFRERAKLRNETKKGNQKSNEIKTNSNRLSEFNDPFTTTNQNEMQTIDLTAASSLLQNIFQPTANLEPIDRTSANDALQNALLTSLMQLNKEMDRCDQEDVMKYTNSYLTHPVEYQRRQSSTNGSNIGIDSTSPSESSYSSSSSSFSSSSSSCNRSSSSTSDWLGLTNNEENPVDFAGITDFTTEDWSQLLEQIADPASLQLPIEIQQDTVSVPEIEILPSSQSMVLASPKKVEYPLIHSKPLPSPLNTPQSLFSHLHFMQSAQMNAERMGLTFEYLHNCNAISSIGEGWSKFQKKQIRFDLNKIDPLKALQISKEQYDIIAYAANTPDIAHLIENKIRKNARTNGPIALQSWHQSKWNWNKVAENMKPTDIQLSIEHHPYIDVAFPWKSMRDKVILLNGILFEPENLCISAMYGDTTTGERAFTIWGDDPSNEMSWEISEFFIRQWWFLIDQSILRQTNWWRRQRGEKAIVEEKIV